MNKRWKHGNDRLTVEDSLCVYMGTSGWCTMGVCTGEIGPTPVSSVYTLGLPDPDGVKPDPDGVIHSPPAKQIMANITAAPIP